MNQPQKNASEIDVHAVLRAMPRFDKFCSVEDLNGLLHRLSEDHRFDVRLAGSSANGLPIHRVCYGKGSVKALFLAFPHPMEPIGGLTVFSLLTLLQQGTLTLRDADVEWNFVTCADPDGTLLNEAWTQEFTVENFLSNYYMPAIRDQAAMSFPVSHKKVVWNQPSKEARVVMELFCQIKPDFYFSLHNTRAGGLWIGLSRDIDHQYHAEIYGLMRMLKFPIKRHAPNTGGTRHFGDGIYELHRFKNLYDYIEQFTPSPESNPLLSDGADEFDYLAEVNPDALQMIAEIGCVEHPYDESERLTTTNLRKLKLQVDAATKYLASVLLDEWEKIQHQIDPTNPFYRAVTGYIVTARSKIAEGGWPLSRYPTAEILADPQNNRIATEGEVFNACVMEGGLYYVQYGSPFLRLLRTSRKTPELEQAVRRAEQAFSEVRAEIGRYIDIHALKVIDHNTLVKVQLGSGLIALNSLLATASNCKD